MMFLVLVSDPYGEWEEDPTKNFAEATLAPSFGAIINTINYRISKIIHD